MQQSSFTSMSLGCPTNYTRDYWFAMPPFGGNLTNISVSDDTANMNIFGVPQWASAPCFINLLAVHIFLVACTAVFFMVVVLGALAAFFNKNKTGREHLVFLFFHATSGA